MVQRPGLLPLVDNRKVGMGLRTVGWTPMAGPWEPLFLLRLVNSCPGQRGAVHSLGGWDQNHLRPGHSE